MMKDTSVPMSFRNTADHSFSIEVKPFKAISHNQRPTLFRKLGVKTQRPLNQDIISSILMLKRQKQGVSE